MRIDPDVEKPLRTMLGHALRGELEEIPRVIGSFRDDQKFREALALCAAISGYVAIQACGNAWPTDVALRKVAENAERTARAVEKFTLNASDVYNYLARTVLSSDPIDQVFRSAEDAVNLPVLITSSMLLTFCPTEQEWWQYLDKIEQSTELAASIDAEAAYPALLLRLKKGRG